MSAFITVLADIKQILGLLDRHDGEYCQYTGLYTLTKLWKLGNKKEKNDLLTKSGGGGTREKMKEEKRRKK